MARMSLHVDPCHVGMPGSVGIDLPDWNQYKGGSWALVVLLDSYFSTTRTFSCCFQCPSIAGQRDISAGSRLVSSSLVRRSNVSRRAWDGAIQWSIQLQHIACDRVHSRILDEDLKSGQRVLQGRINSCHHPGNPNTLSSGPPLQPIAIACRSWFSSGSPRPSTEGSHLKQIHVSSSQKDCQ